MGILTPEKELEVLKIHNMLPGRSVRLISYEETKKNGWVHGDFPELIGQIGKVLEVHSSVYEAVRVELSNDNRYWHFKDLELAFKEIKKPGPILFDPENLVI